MHRNVYKPAIVYLLCSCFSWLGLGQLAYAENQGTTESIHETRQPPNTALSPTNAYGKLLAINPELAVTQVYHQLRESNDELAETVTYKNLQAANKGLWRTSAYENLQQVQAELMVTPAHDNYRAAIYDLMRAQGDASKEAARQALAAARSKLFETEEFEKMSQANAALRQTYEFSQVQEANAALAKTPAYEKVRAAIQDLMKVSDMVYVATVNLNVREKAPSWWNLSLPKKTGELTTGQRVIVQDWKQHNTLLGQEKWAYVNPLPSDSALATSQLSASALPGWVFAGTDEQYLLESSGLRY